MSLTTPSKPWLIASVVVALWCVGPVLYWDYLQRTFNLGYYPPNGDTIVVGLAYHALATVTFAPIMLLCLWLALRRYPGRVSLTLWRADRKPWSWVWTVLCGVAAVSYVAAFVESLRIGLPQNAVADLCWIWVWLVVRAVFVARLKPSPSLPANLAPSSSS